MLELKRLNSYFSIAQGGLDLTSIWIGDDHSVSFMDWSGASGPLTTLYHEGHPRQYYGTDYREVQDMESRASADFEAVLLMLADHVAHRSGSTSQRPSDILVQANYPEAL